MSASGAEIRTGDGDGPARGAAMQNPAELKVLSALLDEVLDLDEAEVNNWFDALQGEAVRYAPLLRELLARRAARETRDLLFERGPGLMPLALGAGAQVGPYRLLSSLGSGGMSEVWLAERADGALARRVALKLPHAAWVPGLAERFARERRILSTLEHPHIARLYDAGIEELGRPYMALEFVDGTPIDVYCRQHALGVEARLRLLLQVADAVVFAHSRLVVHRDLKPGNILVTRDGQARLLDFGIAKLLHGDGSAEETALTKLAGRALTLDYASPEQIRGGQIGTASDVYSLGVVAYELLAGVRPYKLERTSAAALEEAIANVEAPLASAQATTATARQQLRGDLDAILNKALKKSPGDRYATVDALAQEWRRYLDGQRVLARPDTLLYRTARVMRRHRAPIGAGAIVVAAFTLAIGFGATALVIGALSIGLGAAAWQARRAREHARLAQIEARTAEAIQIFLEGIFRASSGDQADPMRARQRTAEELLDEGAARVEAELNDAPAAKLRVLKMLADMYRDMGHYDRVTQLLERHLALAEQIDAGASASRVRALAELGNQMSRFDRADDALELLTRAETFARQLHEVDDDTRVTLDLAWADYYSRRSDARGVAAAQRAAALLGRKPPSQELVRALMLQGDLERTTGLLGDAVRSLRLALSAADGLPGGGGAGRVSPLLQLALAEAANGDRDAAEVVMREGLQVAERTVGVASTWAINMMCNLAQLLAQAGRFRETLDILGDASERLRPLPEGPDKAYVTKSILFVAAPTERSYGDPERALASISEWLALEHSLQSHPTDVAAMLSWRALALLDVAELADARCSVNQALLLRTKHELRNYGGMVYAVQAEIALALVEGDAPRAREVVQRWAEHPQATRQRRPELLAAGAEVALASESADAAAQAARDALAEIARPALAGSARASRFRLLLVLARALLAQGHAEQAMQTASQALAENAAMCDIDRSPDRLLALAALGDAQVASGDRMSAQRALDEARAIQQRHARLGPQYVAPLTRLQAALSAPDGP